MVIFHSYVSLPEGNGYYQQINIAVKGGVWDEPFFWKDIKWNKGDCIITGIDKKLDRGQ